jgi:hypothetical protein
MKRKCKSNDWLQLCFFPQKKHFQIIISKCDTTNATLHSSVPIAWTDICSTTTSNVISAICKLIDRQTVYLFEETVKWIGFFPKYVHWVLFIALWSFEF